VGGGLDPSRAPQTEPGGIGLYIQCEDIPAKLAEIEAAGGRTVKEKTAIGVDYGFYGSFRDPAGNVLGIWART
jgi:predicted enzyme related to lactoylglutathione lyase